MGKAYLKYVGAFLACYLPLFWIQASVQSGELQNPLEIVLGWLFFLGGFNWLLTLLVSAPTLLVVLDRAPGRERSGPSQMTRRALYGVVVGLACLEGWNLLLGERAAILLFLSMAPIPSLTALGLAGGVIGRSSYLPSIRRVATAIGAIAALGLSYRVVIPTALPAFAYRYFDLSIANPIAVNVLRRTQAGDSVARLERQLPGFVPANVLRGEAGGESGLLGAEFRYSIRYRNGLVDSISVGGRLEE